MRIAIIGAGFTGLAAAWCLSKSGHEVDIFEKESLPGGLAIGFSDHNWNWALEKHYHHLFTSDSAIINIAKKTGHRINFYHPTTSTWIQKGIFHLDSPMHLLKFKGLPFIDRLRTGLVLAFLKINPFWKMFESVTTEKLIRTFMGNKSWEILWQPLMVHKFWDFSSQISATWFWARIFKRSSSLGYPEGGFQKLAETLVSTIKTKGGKFYFGTSIKSVTSDMVIATDNGKIYYYEKIICTLPSAQFLKIAPDLGTDYKEKLINLRGIGAVNLVLSLKHAFLPNNIYWLNVNYPKAPFLSVVEHTNLVSSKNYSGKHLVYVGNYLHQDHEYFKLSNTELLSKFITFLKKINPGFNEKWVQNSWVWKATFAQPIIPVNYSNLLPDIHTPVKNLYLANIQQVYPWDRGTNYAVELGIKTARICLKK